ncbi:hypothetical protein IFT59_07220 [Rhizobium sp. CFBP 8752]|uniref:hypothetical protein n=1 Tax=Rhizobium sp. CFBP 8752 TaxID=2775301 RepID=UPI00177A90B2|nr:hypothetical protein [Rhizobium sp. CFBP 8752]MBD8663042.1 hypothetical protein [Rhizobium sp. CFBP 8752]
MSQAQLDDYIKKLQAETKVKARDQVINSLVSIVIGAGLAFWAYGTIPHMVLFSLMVFVIMGVKNSIEQALHQFRASIGAKMPMDHLEM